VIWKLLEDILFCHQTAFVVSDVVEQTGKSQLPLTAVLHCVENKTTHFICYHNFGKLQAILKILSLTDSQGNSPSLCICICYYNTLLH